MMNLTLKEWIILIVALSLIISIVLGIFKHSVKIIITGFLIVVLFSGFTWLPEQIRKWIYTGDDPSQTVDPDMQVGGPDETLKQVGNTVGGFIEENKDSWILAAKSLWNKINGGEGYPN